MSLLVDGSAWRPAILFVLGSRGNRFSKGKYFAVHGERESFCSSH